MNEKDLYRQRVQAKLDLQKAEIAKLKARTTGFNTESHIALHKEVATFERELDHAQSKLSELAAASEEVWDAIINGLESAWHAIKAAEQEAEAKIKAAAK